jgi:hypothetical protein
LPSGDSGDTPPTLEISTSIVSPSSRSIATRDPTATDSSPADSSTRTARCSRSRRMVIRRSRRPCSFFAAWYSKFSERSPWARAVLIASTTSARFGPSSSASSASSCVFWASVRYSGLSGTWAG